MLLSFFFVYSHIHLSRLITGFTVSDQGILHVGIMHIHQKYLEKDSCLGFFQTPISERIRHFQYLHCKYQTKAQTNSCTETLVVIFFKEAYCSFKNVLGKLSHCFWWVSMLTDECMWLHVWAYVCAQLCAFHF